MKFSLNQGLGPARLMAALVLTLGGWPAQASIAMPQAPTDEVTVDGLKNGGFEASENGRPDAWILTSPGPDGEFTWSLDANEKVEGSQALRLDASRGTNAAGQFANCLQSVKAEGWRGKRVRFRAAVRTADLVGDARAQLWMRVDRKPAGQSAQPAPGFFDNMDDRPVRAGEWAWYEIVGDVAKDAENISLGMFVVGAGKAWLDGASLEEVAVDVAVTGSRGVGGELDFGTQPFWNWWLALAAIGMGLMVWGQFSDGWTGRFAFRFSFCYWLLYFFPAPLDSLVYWYGQIAKNWYGQAVVDPAVRWTAANLLGIDKELIAPGGSGDSTFSHVQLLMTFGLALVGAALWSMVHRLAAAGQNPDGKMKLEPEKKGDAGLSAGSNHCRRPVLQDLLRSYVRYVLAFTMLSYGLAKLVSEGGQFRPPGVDQLEKTWGDSSPMNVLWTFMGFSWYYTFFGGLGEVIGGALLVWRRTMVLGALVTFGVMLNVVMLNFCYDVPVKLYSFHLCFAAVFVLLPDAGRLANLLVWNRPVEAALLRPAWSQGVLRVLHIVGKVWLIGSGFVLPVAMTGWSEIQRASGAIVKLPLEGEFRVTEFSATGEPAADEPPTVAWRSFYFVMVPAGESGEEPRAFCIVRLVDHNRLNAQAKLSADQRQLTLIDFAGQPLGELEVREPSPDRFVLAGTAFGHKVEVQLERANLDNYLLMRRGFRWISEQPFNR